MESVESKILTQIRKFQKGQLMFLEDFNRLGSPEAIRVAMHRLENEKTITRVSQGIYVRPKLNRLLGVVMPTAEEVAKAIAKRDRIKIVPAGTYALNALGLSTQIPMKIVFLTDGSPREIKVGNRTIKFKIVTQKNLLAKGDISSLVIQALKEIGKDSLTQVEENKIVGLLKKEDKKDLKHDILLAPVWIQKIMNKALNND